MSCVTDAPRGPGPTGRVLATLNDDGTRRWLRPRVSPGRFFSARRAMAWALMALFTALPFARVGGKPAILLDVAQRRFTVLGTTFLATDTVFLMLLLFGAIVGIFLLTALFGRVWCGWACPQTVYMEFLFRPIERLLEGPAPAQRRQDRQGLGARRALKYAVFLALAFYLANTFLAYFVGTDTLARWITSPPWQHPGGFAVVAVTTALMLFDFGWMREQVCLVACPYGRLQSVLLDKSSLVIAYDARRGEPRGKKPKAGAPPAAPIGDCVDCVACVTTCPTGIDIRAGLQMECIGCAQCIDACDAIMDRLDRPRGLIRYSSQEALEGAPRRVLRPRVVIYPLVLLAIVSTFLVALSRRTPAELTVLRGIGAPFTMLDDGSISNQLRINIVNRTDAAQRHDIAILDADGATVVAPENPLPVPAGGTVETTIFVIAPRSIFERGVREIRVRLRDEAGVETISRYRLLGPDSGRPGRAARKEN